MKTVTHDLVKDNRVFGLVAISTAALLSLPYMAMKLDWRLPDPGSTSLDRMNWSGSDFIIMGVLIYGMATLFILIARRINKSNRLPAAILILVVFLYIWAELAVGIFTNLGS